MIKIQIVDFEFGIGVFKIGVGGFRIEDWEKKNMGNTIIHNSKLPIGYFNTNW